MQGTSLDNPERLAALKDSAVLDRIGDASFDRLVSLARQLTRAKIALISMVDEGRQTFVGQIGLPEPWATLRCTPLSHSFCQHVVTRGRPLVVGDAREEPLVCDNEAVQDLDVVAYLGVPLVTPDGYAIGSICAIDDVPRTWSLEEVGALEKLASLVLTEIAARHELESRRAAERTRDVLFEELNHRIRNLFAVVSGLVRNIPAEEPAVRRFQAELDARLKALSQAHGLVFEGTSRKGALGDSTDIATLADAILMPLPGSERIRRAGPSIVLGNRAALYAALLLHELGTNAVKHGALSVPHGHVELTWRGADGELHLDWVERGGPAARPPTAAGFGTDLVAILTEGSRRPDKAVLFEPVGLTCRTGLGVT